MKRFYSIDPGASPAGISLTKSLYNAPQRTAFAHVRAVGGVLLVACAREDLKVDALGAVPSSNVFMLPEGVAADFMVRKGNQLFVSRPFGAGSTASVAPYFAEDLVNAATQPKPRTMIVRPGRPFPIVTAPHDRAQTVLVRSSGGITISNEFSPVRPTELTTSDYLLPGGVGDVFVVLPGQRLFAVVLGAVPVTVSLLAADGVRDQLTGLVEF